MNDLFVCGLQYTGRSLKIRYTSEVSITEERSHRASLEMIVLSKLKERSEVHFNLVS